MTARRENSATGIFDWGALVIILALGAATVTFGLEAANSPTGLKYGYPPGTYAFLGSVALLAAIGDVRLILRRGISGAQRLARHLWRMCFALFIAAASIFLARQRVFPVVLRTTGVLYLLSILPLILLVFWLIRVRLSSGIPEKVRAQRRQCGIATDLTPWYATPRAGFSNSNRLVRTRLPSLRSGKAAHPYQFALADSDRPSLLFSAGRMTVAE